MYVAEVFGYSGDSTYFLFSRVSDICTFPHEFGNLMQEDHRINLGDFVVGQGQSRTSCIVHISVLGQSRRRSIRHDGVDF
jgi:hypothetical protein